MTSKDSSVRQLAARVRLHVLNMTSRGGSSHIGSCFSIVDILAVLYSKILQIDPKYPTEQGRDRFVLSKGHAGAAVYATLAESGFFSVEKLKDHYQDGSDLSGHVSHKGIPGVELSTGSLGHGLSVAVGMAKAAKLNQQPYRTFALLSDGECDEGANWEAAMFAAHHGLNNLCAIIDYNKLQSLDLVSNTLGLEPFADKWESFGWRVLEVDGHDYDSLEESLHEDSSITQPTVVIAHTTKGKGVSFMEDSVLWHYRTAKDDEYQAALKELSEL